MVAHDGAQGLALGSMSGTRAAMDGQGMRIDEVRAHWDAEAGVWWAFDALVENLRYIVPKMLALNHHAGADKVGFVVRAERREEFACA